MLARCGQVASVIAAGAALWAFWPKLIPFVGGRAFLRKYGARSPEVAGKAMVDSMAESNADYLGLLRNKSKRLRGAGALLLVAIALVGGAKMSSTDKTQEKQWDQTTVPTTTAPPVSPSTTTSPTRT